MVDYSIQSFTKRISELRKLGYDIQSVKGKHPVTGQRYTRYVLMKEV
jgi:biotin operon repressor